MEGDLLTPQDFIAAIGPAAQASAAKTSVPASFTVAQAALESGWGSHAPGNNLFGIKADHSWAGDITTQMTRECIAGHWIVIEAQFRAYPDWQGCMDDHAEFLHANPRYVGAFKHADGEGFARAVAAAGYATDPAYAQKLIATMRAHKLSALDAS